jgi:hypothetical protein
MIDTRVFGYWIVNPRFRMSCMNTLSWLRCSLPIGITWYASKSRVAQRLFLSNDSDAVYQASAREKNRWRQS